MTNVIARVKKGVRRNFPRSVRFARLIFRRRIYVLLVLFKIKKLLTLRVTTQRALDIVYVEDVPRKALKSFSKSKVFSVSLSSIDQYKPSGNWVLLVKGDVSFWRLGQLALAEVLAQVGGELCFYSDHFSRWGQLRAKPAWSPNYFEALDYVGPCLFISPNLAKSAVSLGFDKILMLGNTKHLPFPCYRIIAEDLAAKDSVSKTSSWSERFAERCMVSIIVPTKNGLNFLKPCIDSVLASSQNVEFEILIVDNQSDELEALEYLDKISSNSSVQVLKFDEPFNFSKLNNYAVTHARGDVLLFLNNDTEVISKDWLVQMVDKVRRGNIGCVGAKLLYPDTRVQHAGVIMGYGGGADHAFKFADQCDKGYLGRLETPQNYSAVTAACLMVRREVFEEVGGFDESLQVAFNDVDLCLRVREAGYHNVWLPNVELFHFESPSRGADDTPEKQARFTQELNVLRTRWGKYIESDPAYSPWLALDRHDFAFAKKIDLQQVLTLR